MKTLLILGLIGLVVLCVICPSSRAPAIQSAMQDAALRCVDEVGLDRGLISVSGRDVTLTGSVVSEALTHHLMSCIATFPGTRAIDNQLSVLVPGALGFRTRYGDITVSGVVPTEDVRLALIDEATSWWGSGNVTDALEIDPGRTIGGWAEDDFADFLAVLRHWRCNLDIELSEGQATVAGAVLSELSKSRVFGGAIVLLPEFEVVDLLEIRQPATPREELQAKLDNHLDGKTVEFEVDSANLTPGGRRLLDSVITILRDEPGRIEISVHTGDQGPIADNLELSRRRAETVERYFVAKGLDAGRFEVIGYGPTRPIASNTTTEGQQLNHRTEFHALEENQQ